ncbi:MAG: protein kinase [Ktedonobacteraceae bacterium]|nr:protein kinase [Ktedonobacteraceae bacterium]
MLEKVGEGGFSVVYRAEDITTKDIVAIKAIRLQGLTTLEKIEATDSFNREVQMLSKLEHKNLPRLHNHFSDSEYWYMVMDFIAGTTLEKRMERRKGTPLPIEEVFDIGLILCYVLAHLHNQRPAIIFRDLKPANIILTRDGRLFLIDFGIARHYKPGQTRDTIPFGSPGYAAPEQYGKAQTTPLADIYSLGAILHQLLSGSDPSQTPFRFAPLDDQQQSERAALNTLIQHMVQNNSGQRPSDISIVKRELQTIATQRAFQQGRYTSRATGTFPYPSYIPGSSHPARSAASIWSTGVQPAMTSGVMTGQIQLVQSYPYKQAQRHTSRQRQRPSTRINGYALASLLSGLSGIFASLFLCSFITRSIEIHENIQIIFVFALLLLLPFIASIILGYKGKRKARRRASKSVGIDVANAGITLGYTFSTIYVFFLLWMLFFTTGPK